MNIKRLGLTKFIQIDDYIFNVERIDCIKNDESGIRIYMAYSGGQIINDIDPCLITREKNDEVYNKILNVIKKIGS